MPPVVLVPRFPLDENREDLETAVRGRAAVLSDDADSLEEQLDALE